MFMQSCMMPFQLSPVDMRNSTSSADGKSLKLACRVKNSPCHNHTHTHNTAVVVSSPRQMMLTVKSVGNEALRARGSEQ
jgi:hypothetical protein